MTRAIQPNGAKTQQQRTGYFNQNSASSFIFGGLQAPKQIPVHHNHRQHHHETNSLTSSSRQSNTNTNTNINNNS